MKSKFVKKLVTSSLIALSVITILPATQANAEWKQDKTGWWYTEGNSYVKGQWRQIDGNWYYFYSNGYMAHDTYIGTYYVGSNGAWTNPPTTQKDPFASLNKRGDGGKIHQDKEADARMAEWNK